MEAKKDEIGPVSGALEKYLCGKDFVRHLNESLSEAARGQGCAIITDSMLEGVIQGVCHRMPKPLRKAIPEPNKEFIETCLRPESSKRPRTGCWRVDHLGELSEMVLVYMAASVDKFREIGGNVVDATAL
uniref:Uncharacterized protein n=1 Tax=Lotharella globosa TaxID=91324 RepID=A0A6U3BTL2_9EUKA|mmetsp:Transcript_6498/g.11981  ORF Transcript_6498/g.11981 Transcript_6498/m.11981 type:complete len:130 (+) Transcript_6498:39-428(+)|eukprot:CAMPEP_0167787152 /NCGR_PEP_ID=MMETSP0111_2-20121227/9233_1 /TAXON_ID=91324 /ORGANISM="Lotharella globosa, Strain CCCM811" /LENGTH=129 /DNA_ID=CAMNT_0007678701 /DNA_START=23 /DNA_END=412 /DNA_ORIENTATION=+